MANLTNRIDEILENYFFKFVSHNAQGFAQSMINPDSQEQVAFSLLLESIRISNSVLYENITNDKPSLIDDVIEKTGDFLLNFLTPAEKKNGTDTNSGDDGL
ncbi:MAG: hypothetical protein ACK5Z5_07050 [Neisseriaceae bacterium]